MSINRPRFKPKNGRYFVALIACVKWENAQAIKPELAKIGVYVKYTWLASESNTRAITQRPIPSDCDAVCVIREQIVQRNFRDHVEQNGREACWGFSAAPGASPVRRAFENTGFVGRAPLDLDLIEAEKVSVPSPELVEPQPEKIAPPVEETPAPSPLDIDQLEDSRYRASRAASRGTASKLKPDQLHALATAGLILRGLREKAGLSATAVARAIDCASTNITNIETGRVTPSDAMCIAIERYWDLPAGTIPRLSSRKNNSKVTKAALAHARAVLPVETPPAPAPIVEEEPPKPEPTPMIDAVKHAASFLTGAVARLDEKPISWRDVVAGEPRVAIAAPTESNAPNLPEIAEARDRGELQKLLPRETLQKLSPRETFAIKLVRLQAEAKELGIGYVSITDRSIVVEDRS